MIQTKSRSMDEERIVNDGPGEAHVRITTSGVPLAAIDQEPVAMGIRVRRRWLDAEGAEIPAGTPLLAGDLVTVEVTAKPTDGRWFRTSPSSRSCQWNGFELDLVTAAGAGPADPGRQRHFRDDRLIAFTTLGPDPSVIRYVIGRSSPDHGRYPPDALAMYDGHQGARTPAWRSEP